MKILLSILWLCLLIVQEHHGQSCGTKSLGNNRSTESLNNQRSWCYGTNTILVTVRPTIFRRTNGTGGITLGELDWALNNLQAHFVQANIEFVITNPRIILDDVLFNTLYDDTDDSNDFDDPDLVLQNYMTPDAIDLFFVQNMIAGISGGASLPVHKNGLANERDWIVIDNDFVMQKALVAHEMGHYLSLLHTHQSTADQYDDTPNTFNANEIEFVSRSASLGCHQRGDDLCDTHADPGLSTLSVDINCNYIGTLTDAFGAVYTPDVTNIMSYSRAECLSNFSTQQIFKMRCCLSNYTIGVGRGYVVGDNRPCTGTTWVFLNDDNNYIGCNEHLKWRSPIDNYRIVEARQTIEGYSTIKSSGDVIYQAGQQINLYPGFKVELGGKFKTQIQSCTVVSCVGNPVAAPNHPVTALDAQTTVTMDLKEAPNRLTQLQCYPNPTNSILNVVFTIEQVENVDLQLIDVNGRVVVHLEERELGIGLQQYQLNTEELTGGVYMLVLRSMSNIQTEKIIIQH